MKQFNYLLDLLTIRKINGCKIEEALNFIKKQIFVMAICVREKAGRTNVAIACFILH